MSNAPKKVLDKPVHLYGMDPRPASKNDVLTGRVLAREVQRQNRLPEGQNLMKEDTEDRFCIPHVRFLARNILDRHTTVA
jgi:hypothetical protein